MKSSDRQLFILIAGVVFILVQALAINYKIWWLTFTASGMGLLFAAFLPRAAALPTSKTNRPNAEDWVYGPSRDSLKGQYSEVEAGEPDVPTTDFPITTSFLSPELRLKTPRPSRDYAE